jgi:U3 small nucleolar RNA-associated protein 23
MRGKRSKQYRKLMEQFSQTFGFREPYQVLVDAEMIQDSSRCKMDLEPALSRTVHGKVKPMVTQCEMRKLYATRNEAFINLGQTLERRRCGHHPNEYPEPLSTQECLRSVVDPKDTNQNKHRYVVASQDQEVRRMLRGIKGVPLIYIKRSVMILEPMADESVQLRAREERSKFRAEIKSSAGKRKREDADDDDEKADKKDIGTTEDQKKKKKKGYGAKGPNPLAVQKPKKPKADGQQPRKQESSEATENPQEGAGKRKRRRRNKISETEGQDEANTTTTAEVTMTDA